MIDAEDVLSWPMETRVLVDFLTERAIAPQDVSPDAVKAVNDAAQRVARYRMRALTWEELEKLGVGLFGRATYEAWSGNTPIAPAEPFTLAQFERATRLLMGERCPMRGCEEDDGVQREVPVHVTEEEFQREQQQLQPTDFMTEQLQRAFARLAPAPDGYTLDDVIDYVQRVLGDRHPSLAAQVRLYAGQHREPDGRIDRVTVAAQVAAWMQHPSMEILQANAAQHRWASRRRWDERVRLIGMPHPELVFRR